MNVGKITTTLAVALVLALTATGLWAAASDEEPAAAADKQYVTDPTTGKEILAPVYGGTFFAGYNGQPDGTDPSVGRHHAGFLLSGVNEKLSQGNWGIDRSVYDYSTELVADVAYTGALAESWETPDQLTYVFHIRKGVHWHDKEPLNGRELTAKDIEYNYHRLMGLGSGFTDYPGYTLQLPQVPAESVTAVDDYTVVFKLKTPSLAAFRVIIDDALAYILPPEVIMEKGDVNDWRDVVGTGPYMLTDWVDGSSITWERNPNYWGFDEKFPDNRLPYIDRVEALIMPDESTRLSALRTGKIDFIGHGARGSNIRVLETAENLAETNPDIVLYPWYFRSNYAFAFNMTAPPFDDIRVRIAMQLALDNETFHNTFFGGASFWQPQAYLGDGWVGYVTPYDEWPDELKEEYAYNPERAEELLDEAGYPRGADGIRIRTNLDHWTSTPEWAELVKSYWSKIGVDVTLTPVEGASHVARIKDLSYGGLVQSIAGTPYPPVDALSTFEVGHQWNRGQFDDPTYNAIVAAAREATTIEELKEQSIKGSMYWVEQHVQTWGPKGPLYQAAQPWVIGFNGEVTLGGMNYGGIIWARLWLDSALKKELGY